MKTVFFAIILCLATCQPSPVTIKKQEKLLRIGLLQLGQMDNKFVRLAKQEIEGFYLSEAVDLGTKALPQQAFYPPRNRYRADVIISWLREIRPDSVDLILALTESDISSTKGEYKDWGIMGLGYMPGVSCVVSTFRLKKGARSEQHIEERFSKIILHELGHNLGINHCNSPACLMRDACGTVKTIDEEKKEICADCRKKAGTLIRSAKNG